MKTLSKVKTHPFIRVCLIMLILLLEIGIAGLSVHAAQRNGSALKVTVQAGERSTSQPTSDFHRK